VRELAAFIASVPVTVESAFIRSGVDGCGSHQDTRREKRGDSDISDHGHSFAETSAEGVKLDRERLATLSKQEVM
jgi:hypothetical protein